MLDPVVSGCRGLQRLQRSQHPADGWKRDEFGVRRIRSPHDDLVHRQRVIGRSFASLGKYENGSPSVPFRLDL